MFTHAVLMRLVDVDGDFHARVAACVARVRREVAALISYHYGPNLADRGRGYDWVVLGVFASAAAHDAYQVSAAHLELKDLMTPHIAELVVCDLDHGELP